MANTAYIHFQITILVIENVFQLAIFLQVNKERNIKKIISSKFFKNQYLCTEYFDISVDFSMQFFD